VTFEDGTRVSLNGTNVSTLLDAFGSIEHEDWIGQRIELYAGTLRYNGNDNPAGWCGRSIRRRLRSRPSHRNRSRRSTTKCHFETACAGSRR
jgi:hypothetical protein